MPDIKESSILFALRFVLSIPHLLKRWLFFQFSSGKLRMPSFCYIHACCVIVTSSLSLSVCMYVYNNDNSSLQRLSPGTSYSQHPKGVCLFYFVSFTFCMWQWNFCSNVLKKVCALNCKYSHGWKNDEIKNNQNCEARLTAGFLKQDPNTQMVKKNATFNRAVQSVLIFCTAPLILVFFF